MFSKLALLSLACLATGCTTTAQLVRQGYPAGVHPLARNPWEVQRYLEAHVPPKTLKKWDKHVSDDTVVLEFSEESGTAK